MNKQTENAIIHKEWKGEQLLSTSWNGKYGASNQENKDWKQTLDMPQEALYNFNKKLKNPNNSIRHVLQFTTNEIYVSPTTPAKLRHNSMQLQSLYTAIWRKLRGILHQITRHSDADCNAINNKTRKRGKPLLTFPDTKIILFKGECKSKMK